MKKYLILCMIIILITGCSKDIEMEINSTIKHDDDKFISVNYPQTNIKKLNKYIKHDVSEIVDTFNNLDSEDKELNIDYTYFVVNNNYINISLKKYISYNNQESEDIYTYVFDKNKNKLLKVDDIIRNKDEYQNKITNKFIFNEDYITFFSVQNSKTIENKIKLNSNNTKISINKKIENNSINYDIVNKEVNLNNPIIALTFDDGPSKYTKQIIDLLKKYNCNATFFVLGNKVKNYKEVIKEAISYGNEIGNHSYNHRWLSRLNPEEIKEQINKTQDILKTELNYTATLLRPTYGSVNKKIRNNTNLKIVLWNVDTLDWKIKSSKKIAERALPKIKDESIILMHDTHKRTYETLKIMIPKLIDDGYQFVTISELNKIKNLRNISVNEQ